MELKELKLFQKENIRNIPLDQINESSVVLENVCKENNISYVKPPRMYDVDRMHYYERILANEGLYAMIKAVNDNLETEDYIMLKSDLSDVDKNLLNDIISNMSENTTIYEADTNDKMNYNLLVEEAIKEGRTK